MDWREWCETLGIQKQPAVTASYVPHGKEEKVKMRLPLMSSVQQVQEAINSENEGAPKEFSLFLPTKNQHQLCLKSHLPLWRYNYSKSAFSNLSIEPGENSQRMGLVVLNNREHQNGEASLFSFSPDTLSSDVVDTIIHYFSLSIDLKFYGLFVYEKKNRGRFVSAKKTLAEHSIGEMSVVEVRHLGVFEFVEKSKNSAPVRFHFRDQVLVEDALKEMVQGLPPPPNGSSFSLLHLPYGEKSSSENWLTSNNTLKSCRIGTGSLLILCDSTESGGVRQRGTTHRPLYVSHSPYPAHHNWRSMPNHPKRLVGEKLMGTIHNVILLKPGGRKVKGDLHLTNANVVFAAFSPSFSSYSSYSVTPLLSVARIEISQSTNGVDLFCKNVRTVRFVTPNSSQRNHLVQKLDKLVFPTKTRDIFAFAMKAAFQERDDGWDLFQGFHQEMTRQAIPENRWRVSFINAGYQLCDSYPSQVIVPASFNDQELLDVFSYRSKGRIPVLTYYHSSNGASITRSSQPMPGLSGRTCTNDEKLLECIRTANNLLPQPSPLYIFDARPRINAMGNQAAGAGYEVTGSGTGYPDCKLEFLNIDNIHVIRKCHTTLQFIMEERLEGPNWYSLVESSGWLAQVRLILLGAVRVVEVIENEAASVLVHCSDGWDRTSQVSALSQIMLCPHFRTIEGFQLLLEKDWLTFGHKFAQRHGQADRNADDQQRAPIFLQFIDAVWQMTEQFPCSFEFNSHFLLDIVDASYACHTGTFLGNSELERKEAELRRKTVSLWTFMKQTRSSYENVFFVPDLLTVVPNLSPDHISVWKDYFLRSRWEGKVNGLGCSTVSGMTPTLRFMQVQSMLEGKASAHEAAVAENSALKKRFSSLHETVKEHLGSSFLDEIEEPEPEEEEEEIPSSEARELIERLKSRILLLENELKARGSPSSPSFPSSPPSSPSFTSSPPTSPPSSYMSSPLPFRPAPAPPQLEMTSPQKSLSSFISQPRSMLPNLIPGAKTSASADFSDWLIVGGGPSEEARASPDRTKGKKEGEGREGEEGRVVVQKRRLGAERTTPSPSSDPIL